MEYIYDSIEKCGLRANASCIAMVWRRTDRTKCITYTKCPAWLMAWTSCTDIFVGGRPLAALLPWAYTSPWSDHEIQFEIGKWRDKLRWVYVMSTLGDVLEWRRWRWWKWWPPVLRQWKQHTTSTSPSSFTTAFLDPRLSVASFTTETMARNWWGIVLIRDTH